MFTFFLHIININTCLLSICLSFPEIAPKNLIPICLLRKYNHTVNCYLDFDNKTSSIILAMAKC